MNEGELLETQIYCIAALMFSFLFLKKKKLSVLKIVTLSFKQKVFWGKRMI